MWCRFFVAQIRPIVPLKLILNFDISGPVVGNLLFSLPKFIDERDHVADVVALWKNDKSQKK